MYTEIIKLNGLHCEVGEIHDSASDHAVQRLLIDALTPGPKQAHLSFVRLISNHFNSIFRSLGLFNIYICMCVYIMYSKV